MVSVPEGAIPRKTIHTRGRMYSSKYISLALAINPKSIKSPKSVKILFIINVLAVHETVRIRNIANINALRDTGASL